MSGVAILQWIGGAALLAGLGALLFTRLRAAKYDCATAIVLSGLGLAQPAFWNSHVFTSASIFAAMVCAVALAAISLVEQQDVRRIALLGGSLAGAQLIHPLWGSAATIMLPLALRGRLATRNGGGGTGLYISIVFIPAFTAAAMFSLDASFRSEILSLAAMHLRTHLSLAFSLRAVAAVLVPAIPLLVGFAMRPSEAAIQVITAIALALIVVCVALDLLAIEFAAISAAFGLLTVLLLAAWPVSGTRSRWGMLLAAAAVVAGWTPVWLTQANA